MTKNGTVCRGIGQVCLIIHWAHEVSRDSPKAETSVAFHVDRYVRVAHPKTWKVEEVVWKGQ